MMLAIDAGAEDFTSEEEVYEVVRALGFSESDVTALDVDSIYKHYGYNLDDVFELKLEEERK